MKKETKPIRLFLARETFNTLMSVFEFFINSESIIGKTYFSEYSEQLKNTFLKFCKAIENKDGDMASIFLYEAETAVLIKILLHYSSLSVDNKTDFYNQLNTFAKK